MQMQTLTFLPLEIRKATAHKLVIDTKMCGNYGLFGWVPGCPVARCPVARPGCPDAGARLPGARLPGCPGARCPGARVPVSQCGARARVYVGRAVVDSLEREWYEIRACVFT